MNKVEVGTGKAVLVLITGFEVTIGNGDCIGRVVGVAVDPADIVRDGSGTIGASGGCVVDGWIVPVDLSELSGVTPTTLGVATGFSCFLGLHAHNETASNSAVVQYRNFMWLRTS